MAEAVVGKVLDKLIFRAGREVGLFLGFNQEKKKFESMFTAIKATVQDAENKQFSDEGERIKDWLRKLKDVAYELDDIMDECAYEALRLEYQGVNSGPSDKVQQCSCLSFFHPKHVAFRYEFSKKMKRISKRLKEIYDESTQFGFTPTVQERTSGVPEWRQTMSYTTEPQVYGREEDTRRIVDSLIGRDADASHFENLSVYPIVGLGGLGKTTLAQLIFNHERVVNHFELKMWVCVSEDFSLTSMMKTIIKEASDQPFQDLNLESLQKKLQDLLRTKRYLLVLDDVWDDERENWQKLKTILSCGAKGSSILVTTRLPKVAALMGTMPPYELSVLSDDDGWELFKNQAFELNEVESAELVGIGKEIVKKCGGVPLAAKAMGGLLRFKRNKNHWLKVKESNLLELSHSENSIMPVLRVSYLNLPSKLRQCFAYCSIFPKDKVIKKQYLIELWMANEFISSDGRLDAEDVGNDVWNELYWRSFFQDIGTDKFGNITSFKMHDLVHDLAQLVAGDVFCNINDDDVTTLAERIHHLSHYRCFSNSIHLHQVKYLRTYILSYYSGQLSPHVLKCYSLRALDFVKREKLSSSIGDLKHLRYLNLSQGQFETLPESICKLWNLQTLKLDDCCNLQKLPNSLTHLKALQQLSLNGCHSLLSLAPEIRQLNSLRILSTYIVGEEKGFFLEELGPLKLKGSLHIKHMEKVKSVKDAEEACMSSKPLNELMLSWSTSGESKLQEKILDVLQPNIQQLQNLTVSGYNGGHFPQWMSAPYLKYLTLFDCKSCSQLPALARLPSLKELRITSMNKVKYISQEWYSGGVVFMALEHLSLNYLPNLIRLSREDAENMFPRLSTLEITECPNFLAEEVLLHRLHSLKRLEIGKCDMFKVSVGFQCLTCLEHLSIRRCTEVIGLREALQHMTSLKELHLEYLSNLGSLPDCFGNLPMLRQLIIHKCSKLMCLPRSLRRSSLQYLTIDGCPELKEQYEKETGVFWPNIAHIPHITVNDHYYD